MGIEERWQLVGMVIHKGKMRALVKERDGQDGRQDDSSGAVAPDVCGVHRKVYWNELERSG